MDVSPNRRSGIADWHLYDFRVNQDLCGARTGLLTGIGVFSRAGGDIHLFALTAVFVFDGHTFEILKKRAGSPVEEKTGSNPTLFDLTRTNPMSGANVPLKDFSWPPPQDAGMGLRDATRALLAESLDKTLPKLLAPKSADEE